MDSATRRPQLPALSYLDVDKPKRDADTLHHRSAAAASQSLSSSTAPSPTNAYPTGPPPPYTHARNPPAAPSSSTNLWAPAPAAHPSPDSTRGAEDNSEGSKSTTRQSLPSLSEVIGVDSQAAFVTSASQVPSITSSHMPPLPPLSSAAPSSPSPTSRRPYRMDPMPTSANSYPATMNTYQSYSQFRPEVSQPPPSYPSAPEAKPPPPSTSTAHMPSKPAPYAPTDRAPAYEQPASNPPNTSMPPPNYPYGYASYPPRYPNPPPATGVSSGPIYSPSAAHSAPRPQTSPWNPEGSRYDDPPFHSESVKRHLDLYDLEQALGEVAKSSSILADFSRRYSDRMHQTQRSGYSPATLPSIVEVDDMISKSRMQLDSLSHIRGAVVAQQAAYEQQAADQRQPRKIFAEPGPMQPDHATENDDGKGGFAGSDTKKRRGRAAPPGRCHSCNRAETPEWRRGPDGARTLCNACGLHYAKLTRKNNNASKTANVASSTLRPKEQ